MENSFSKKKHLIALMLVLVLLIVMGMMLLINKKTYFGGRQLCVPPSYIVRMDDRSMATLLDLRFDVSHVLIDIPISELLPHGIADAIVGMKDRDRVITVEMQPIKEWEIQRAKTEHTYHALWKKESPFYTDRIVISDENSGNYFVYPKERSTRWYIFSKFPDPKLEVPVDRFDFILASCSSNPTNGVFNRDDAKCQGSYVDNGVYVVYYFSSVYKSKVLELMTAIKRKLNIWQNC